MWYVIQTMTGKEQELVEEIQKLVPREAYDRCFYIRRQLLKRLGGEWLEVTETLFPAYVFLEAREPEPVFFHLKQVPEFSRILGDNQGTFIPLEAAETAFLQTICRNSEKTGPFFLVNLSRLWLNEDGSIRRIAGPLLAFQEQIVRLNLRKRYAMVHTPLCGGERNALLGVRIEEAAGAPKAISMDFDT